MTSDLRKTCKIWQQLLLFVRKSEMLAIIKHKPVSAPKNTCIFLKQMLRNPFVFHDYINLSLWSLCANSDIQYYCKHHRNHQKKHKSSVTVNRTIDVWWQSFVLHEFHALNMLPRVCLFFFLGASQTGTSSSSVVLFHCQPRTKAYFTLLLNFLSFFFSHL